MAKDSVLAIRISENFKEKVRQLAEREGMAMSEYIMDILKQKVWEAEKDGKLPRSGK